MSKRWFTTSFEPPDCASSCTKWETTERETMAKTSASTLRRTKKARTFAADQRKTRPHDNADRRDADSNMVDVLSKYEPETPDDLVVHVKKVEQVRQWIEDRIACGRRAVGGKYVLLHGPSGCGKSTTLRVLARSLNVQIVEWITPVDREQTFTSSAIADDDDSNDQENDQGNADDRYFRGRGATELFDSFLWRASRYSCLGGSLVYGHSSPQPPVLKIILVKDFPHSFVQNAQSFHDILRKYAAYETYPIAFVCNDDALCRKLFPDALREECGVHDIAFNAVNCTAVTKALKRLLELELRLNPTLVIASPNQLSFQTFHQQSAGDLRRALLKFYFTIVRPTQQPPPSSSKSSSLKLKTDEMAATNASNVNYQHCVDLFKTLGRILYCKREMPAAATQPDSDRRYKFVYDPEQLVTSVADQPSSFVAFLQENYVSRFQNVVGVALAADTFCVADAVFKHCYKDTASDAIALSCVVRRLMVSNDRPNKSFSPFLKPKTYDSAETSAARFSRSIRSAFPHLQLPTSELVMHVLPFASSIPSLKIDFQPYLPLLRSPDTGATLSLITAR